MGDLFVLLVLQPHNLQHLAHIPFRDVPQRLHDTQIFLPGQVAVVAGAFDEAAHLLEDVQPVLLIDRLAKDGNLPGGGVHQTQNHLEGGGLARTVWPQKAVDAAFRHREVEASDPHALAILLAEAGGLYNIHKGFLLFLICFQDTTPALHADEGKLTFTLLFFFSE